VKGVSLSDRNTMEQPAQISPKIHIVAIKGQKISTNLPPLSCLLIELK
jgi:alpha-L-arabinofuranosidase